MKVCLKFRGDLFIANNRTLYYNHITGGNSQYVRRCLNGWWSSLVITQNSTVDHQSLQVNLTWQTQTKIVSCFIASLYILSLVSIDL